MTAAFRNALLSFREAWELVDYLTAALPPIEEGS